MFVSHEVFTWFLTALIVCVSVPWIVVDIMRLRRIVSEGQAAHDRIFGSIIGLLVSLAGIVGVLRHHLW